MGVGERVIISPSSQPASHRTKRDRRHTSTRSFPFHSWAALLSLTAKNIIGDLHMRAARIVATSLFIRPLLPFPTTSLYHSLTNHRIVSVTTATAMSTTTSTSPQIKNGVRVVSYNLLSSKLARPSHFTHAEPEHLEFDYRLGIILAKLDEEMNRGFGENKDSQQWIPPSIFALQEVCYPFASALHTFFAHRGYHFVTGLYGKQFNGYVINCVAAK